MPINSENGVEVSNPVTQAENLLSALAQLNSVYKGDEKEFSKRVLTANKMYDAIQHAVKEIEDKKTKQYILARAEKVMNVIMSPSKSSPDDRYIVRAKSEA